MDGRGALRKASFGGRFASAAKGLKLDVEKRDGIVSEYIAWESAHHLGDLASIAGIALSIIGFAVTIAGVLSSRNAAQRAEAAAKAAVHRVRVFDDVMNLSAAVTTLDEIRRFHRLREWTLLPDRYTSLRRTLLLVRSSGLPLTNDQNDVLRAALVTLSDVERMVEQGISKPERLDGAKLNARLGPHLDNLYMVLGELRLNFTDRVNA